VALGLVELLSRVGFYRPIVSGVPDNDLELIRSRDQVPDDRIGDAYTAAQRLTSARPSVPAWDESSSGSSRSNRPATSWWSRGPTSLGRRRSNSRSTPESPNTSDYRSWRSSTGTAAEFVERIVFGRDSFGEDAIAAIIVNRVEPAALETLDDALAPTELDDPVWAIAEEPTLRQPSLDQRPYVLAGGEVVVIGTTDWVFGLAVDAAVSKVTANSLDRYVGR